MDALTIKNTKDTIVFTIDKHNFTDEIWMRMMNIARVECLLEKANFDDGLLQFGDELKSLLWQENKATFLNGLD